MSPLPIDPAMATTGAEWTVPGVASAPAPAGSGFGQVLAGELDRLTQVQADAASAARSLATGQAADPETVVMAVERARLSMQLASQLRTKALEAFTDVFHTQI